MTCPQQVTGSILRVVMDAAKWISCLVNYSDIWLTLNVVDAPSCQPYSLQLNYVLFDLSLSCSGNRCAIFAHKHWQVQNTGHSAYLKQVIDTSYRCYYNYTG